MLSCNNEKHNADAIYFPSNILDYTGTPINFEDRNLLVFSDQGAWFAYGFSNEAKYYGGFLDPFLMTQGNGAWSSKILSQLKLSNVKNNNLIDWSNFKVSRTSYNSHLEQVFENENLKISQKLFFISAHSAMIITQISNLSNQIIKLKPSWSGSAFLKGLQVKKEDENVLITSSESTAKGLIQILGDKVTKLVVKDSSYFIEIESFKLKHSGVFPSYHYIWFNGFWAWDSWKHAAAIAQYNVSLAKDQIKAMYDYQTNDGSLIAAKWESGMDNAVRFDNSKILKNSETAYSLNQESVDLNAYLFAEKKYLIEMAKALNKIENVEILEKQAKTLKKKIQNQFFDEETGWFYDTSIDGEEFIREMGCEGWIPLWAKLATKKQAERVKNNMMNTTLFIIAYKRIVIRV